jgi:amidase
MAYQSEGARSHSGWILKRARQRPCRRELVDFALGTDCGGSVRLPASYCGTFGIRFDTISWFARNAAMMGKSERYYCHVAKTFAPTRLLIAIDAFTATGPEITCGLLDWIASHFD